MRSSILDESVVSALLNLVLGSMKSTKCRFVEISRHTTDLSIGGYFSLLMMVIPPVYPFSLKLSTAWNAPLPPPTISTPPLPPPRSLVDESLGARAMLGLVVRAGSAVTCIFPPETCALKEWMADGAGASSVEDQLGNTRRRKGSEHTNVTGADVEAG